MPHNPGNPTGRVVVIYHRADGLFGVTVMPAPQSGDIFRTFVMKADAFEFAREMWTELCCGLEDRTTWSGPYVPAPPEK